VLQAIEQTHFSIYPSLKNLSPFIKWAGGKTSLLAHLLPNVPSNVSNYYEPFLGGAALFFAISGRRTRFNAHLSDTNAELITTYRVIKEFPDHLIEVLSIFQKEYDRAADKMRYFYAKREWEPETPVELAARLIFLNKTCYNGLYRVNSKGEFNVPFGRYKHPRILNSENIRTISQILKNTNAELRSTDYKDAVASCGNADFVYLDPPYSPPSKTSKFTSYTRDGFSEKDQEELAKAFGELVDRGCTVVLSNSDTALTRRLYSDFEITKVTVNRPINSVGTRRMGYRELIVIGRPRST
jgi:DNA adenine methylase